MLPRPPNHPTPPRDFFHRGQEKKGVAGYRVLRKLEKSHEVGAVLARLKLKPAQNSLRAYSEDLAGASRRDVWFPVDYDLVDAMWHRLPSEQVSSAHMGRSASQAAE